MFEIIETLAIIGSVVGALIGVVKHSEKRLCKDIEEIKKELKEIHKEVFH
tara:strand:- start:7868 stop:8017 length:150 start_codon:yes stop_codon:yes gene_type:complete